MASVDDQQTPDVLDEVDDDVVEGDAEPFDEPAATAVDNGAGASTPITLSAAVMEYFSWEEEREAKRTRRKTTNSARSRRSVFVLDKPAREAVARFLGHFGPDTPLAELSPKSMESFQETIGVKAMGLEARLQPVKEFLRYCWKQEYTVSFDAAGRATAQNLGNFLRIKRPATVVRGKSQFQHEQAETFEMTAEGLQNLHKELEELNEKMPKLVEDVAAAREDKDIRENAPLEEARKDLGENQSRINDLHYQIARAVVPEQRASDRAQLGSVVSVVELDEHGGSLGEAREYTLVGTTEANAAERRISVESPLGRGLLDQPADRQIEIQAPNGRRRFRLLSVKDSPPAEPSESD